MIDAYKTMTQERLVNLAIMSTESDILCKIHFAAIINDFEFRLYVGHEGTTCIMLILTDYYTITFNFVTYYMLTRPAFQLLQSPV